MGTAAGTGGSSAEAAAEKESTYHPFPFRSSPEYASPAYPSPATGVAGAAAGSRSYPSPAAGAAADNPAYLSTATGSEAARGAAVATESPVLSSAHKVVSAAAFGSAQPRFGSACKLAGARGSDEWDIRDMGKQGPLPDG